MLDSRAWFKTRNNQSTRSTFLYEDRKWIEKEEESHESEEPPGTVKVEEVPVLLGYFGFL